MRKYISYKYIFLLGLLLCMTYLFFSAAQNNPATLQENFQIKSKIVDDVKSMYKQKRRKATLLKEEFTDKIQTNIARFIRKKNL